MSAGTAGGAVRPTLTPTSCERPRLLLLAPPDSYRLKAYLDSAARLGVAVLTASAGAYSLVQELAAGLHIDFTRPDQALATILAATSTAAPAGVVATDDAAAELAARVAQHFQLPHNDPAAARLTRRKDLARRRLREAGLPVPAFWILDLGDAALSPAAARRLWQAQLTDVRFPCVVKPVALAGSRGVIRADKLDDLLAACERVRALLLSMPGLPEEERQQLLIEAYIPGAEFAVEGLLRRGRLQPLALFDKPEPMPGPFFEESYYITPSRLPAVAQERIWTRVQEVCAAYGLREGPVHAEVRLWQDEVWLLEAAARTIGGQCARLLQLGTGGQSLEDLVISSALNRAPPPLAVDGAGGVLMIPIPRAGVLRRVEGVLQAQRQPFIEDVEISVPAGYELIPLPEGASYLGFIFARAPTPDQAEQALRAAHAQLNVVTAPCLLRQGPGMSAAPNDGGPAHV